MPNRIRAEAEPAAREVAVAGAVVLGALAEGGVGDVAGVQVGLVAELLMVAIASAWIPGGPCAAAGALGDLDYPRAAVIDAVRRLTAHDGAHRYPFADADSGPIGAAQNGSFWRTSEAVRTHACPVPNKSARHDACDLGWPD